MLECDATKYVLGTCLMQIGKPLAFASKSLTQNKIGYAKIEKVLYEILFDCKRFHQYTYVWPVIVYSDH